MTEFGGIGLDNKLVEQGCEFLAFVLGSFLPVTAKHEAADGRRIKSFFVKLAEARPQFFGGETFLGQGIDGPVPEILNEGTSLFEGSLGADGGYGKNKAKRHK